jgi:hypothetical protein
MKRTLLLFTLALFCTALTAQRNAIDKYFKQHLENPAFSKYEITGKTFELITEIETNNAAERRVVDAVGKIEGVYVLSNQKTSISKEYYYEAMDKLVPDEDYQDLVVVENKSTNVRFLIREDEEAIREFVMVAGERENFVIASIYGIIDIASISKIAEVIKTNGKKWESFFKNVDSEELVFSDDTKKPGIGLENQTSKTSINNLKLNIFPNPATKFINISPANGIAADMEVSFYSLLGKEIQNVGQVTLPYRLSLDDLPSGAYFLRLTDKDGEFKNFRIVKPSTNN